MPFASSTVLADHPASPGRSRRVVALLVAFAVVAGLVVAVAVGRSSAAVVLGPNLLDNSDFVDGTSGWAPPRRKAISESTSTAGVFGSGHSLRLVTSKAVNARVDDAGADWPTVTAGPTFVATAWVRTTGSPATGLIRIREWAGDRVVRTVATPFEATTDWQRVWVRHVVQRDGTRLQVSVIFPDLRAGAPVQVDRVMLRRVLQSDGPGVTPPPDDPDDPGDPGGGTDGSGPLFGASVWVSGTTWQDAVAASDQRYGRLDVVRVFYPGLPEAWPGRAGVLDRPVVVSFKDDPDHVLSGADDAYLRHWFATAPRDRDIWWTLWHEPEDDVAAGRFTAAAWRAAVRHVAALADEADNPDLHATVVLMCWTATAQSGRSVDDFFPGADVVDAIGWDCYSHPNDPTTYVAPADMYGEAVAASEQLGVDWGIAETGSRLVPGDDGGKRAAWLHDIARYTSDHGADFVTYFDSVVGGEFRLLDDPSRQAWHDVVTPSSAG
jgi:hypothetical protein